MSAYLGLAGPISVVAGDALGPALNSPAALPRRQTS